MRRRDAATSSCATRIPVNTTSLCYYPLSIRLRRPPTPSQTPLEVPMSSKLKWIGIVIVAILVILIVVPFLIPINKFKPTIESKASEGLGRKVQLGNLSLWLLTGSVGIDTVSVSDDPKFNSGLCLTAQTWKVGTGLIPQTISPQLNTTDITSV